jgi:hypothetical protein
VPSQPPAVAVEPAEEPGAEVGAEVARGGVQGPSVLRWWWWERWVEWERGGADFSVGVGERPSRETWLGAMEGARVGALREKVE